MQTLARALIPAACLACWLVLPAVLGASEVVVRLIMHPSRTDVVTPTEVRAIYLKQKIFWDDGKPIIPINREAGSDARELFSERIFGQRSRRLATYWNQRYFEAGEFPPPTLASEEAVIRFVAGNENAIGYITREEVRDVVAVVLILR